MGYHKVKIAPKDQLKTTFTTPWGTFCYTVMPFGLCNAPGTFQRLMNKVFDPFLGLFLRVFIDDFGVYNDRASHLAKLELVFQHLDSSGLTLSPEKTTIGFSKGKMVGHIVSKDGVARDPKKLEMFYDKPLENVTPHVFCMSFVMGSMEATLRDESLQKIFCKQVIIGPPSLRTPMIIAGVMMCVKPMHKGLL